MNAWSGEQQEDVMGPTVTRVASGKPSTPPLKNGNELRESGYLIAVGSRTARFRRKHKNQLLIIILLLLFLLLLALAIAMTVLYMKQKRNKPIKICESRECLRSAANLALTMDLTADPCQDFYQYMCGNWAEEHPRPDTFRSYDWFRDKQSKVFAAVRDFLSHNSSTQPRPVQQAKLMYASCMDTETIDKRRIKPVLKVLDSIGLPSFPTYINVTNQFDYPLYTFDWLDAIIKIKVQLGMDVLIGFDIYTDPKNSSVYRLVMGSPETTNPFPSMHNEKKRHARWNTGQKTNHKSHLLYNKVLNNKREAHKDIDDDDEKTSNIYKLFYAELMKIFILEAGGMKNSSLSEVELDQNIILAANEYYNIDSDLYEIDSSNDTEASEDLYHSTPDYTVREIQAHTDMIVDNNNGTVTPIWQKYLQGVFKNSKVSLDFEKDKILVSDPDLKYMSLMAVMVSKLPPVTIELYIWVKVTEVMAVHTTTEIRALFQRAYDQLHVGKATAPPARSLQCASAVNDMLGLAVSYGLADPRFINVTKPKIHTMLDELKNALARLVGKTKWMDDETKLATYQKIIQMKTLVGFPDWLLDEWKLERYYDGVQINAGTHLENLINIVQVKTRKALNRLRDVHNVTWATDPTEVNAYHTFQENTITPYVIYSSLNYGSLGTILGHEITHGFDNFGRQFDKNGNFLPWWTNETIESFVNMTQCFVDQYSSYYIPELEEHVDGKKTLSENIADNGGLREALVALKEHLRKVGPEPKLPGFEHMTSEQLFFLSYGNLWCGVTTKDSLKSDLQDEHSPQHFRPKGSLQNSADFARVWHCPPNSPMNPRRKCIIF